MHFYLGLQEFTDLSHVNVPAFPSRARMIRKEKGKTRNVLTYPRAKTLWAMDSGGFTQITKHGGWFITAREFIREVDFLAREIGNCEWSSPMDWMTEDKALKASGKTVAEHQRLTLENFVEIRTIGSRTHFIPVLQGRTVADYLRHAEQYERAGIDLRNEPRVGIGSVCRRQVSGEAIEVITAVAKLGLKIHAYGLSSAALGPASSLIVSADSQAWSYAARYRGNDTKTNCGEYEESKTGRILMPGHRHSKDPKKNDCRNCVVWALKWRNELLATLPRGRVTDHPSVETQADREWQAREARRLSVPEPPKKPRGAPTPIEVAKLVRQAYEVVQTNLLLQLEEHSGMARGTLNHGQFALPKTKRAALKPATATALLKWRSFISTREGRGAGDANTDRTIGQALAAEAGGVYRGPVAPDPGPVGVYGLPLKEAKAPAPVAKPVAAPRKYVETAGYYSDDDEAYANPSGSVVDRWWPKTLRANPSNDDEPFKNDVTKTSELIVRPEEIFAFTPAATRAAVKIVLSRLRDIPLAVAFALTENVSPHISAHRLAYGGQNGTYVWIQKTYGSRLLEIMVLTTNGPGLTSIQMPDWMAGLRSVGFKIYVSGFGTGMRWAGFADPR